MSAGIGTLKKPSDLDKRAAKGFQELANASPFFSVACRFRRRLRSRDGETKNFLWRRGAEEFRMHFGPGANYFAGAVEYIHLATGWKYPHRHLEVMILANKRRTSGGVAIYPPGIRGDPSSGEIRIDWADSEFTLTVLHELIHLFRRGYTEDWVEQKALILTMGV